MTRKQSRGTSAWLTIAGTAAVFVSALLFLGCSAEAPGSRPGSEAGVASDGGGDGGGGGGQDTGAIKPGSDASVSPDGGGGKDTGIKPPDGGSSSKDTGITRAEWYGKYAISTNCQGTAAVCAKLPGCGYGDKKYVD